MSEVQVTETPLSDLTVLLSQLHLLLARPLALSMSLPSLPLIFQHFAWDTWKLFSLHLDCMAASASLIFTELVN